MDVGHCWDGAGCGASGSAGGSMVRVGEGGGGVGALAVWLSNGAQSWALTGVEQSCW